MISRDVISIETIKDDAHNVVVKKRGCAYIETHSFAVCHFDLRMLPMRLNLPMVCKPLDWKHPYDFEFEIALLKTLRQKRGLSFRSASTELTCRAY
jgi:hypothetical protein